MSKPVELSMEQLFSLRSFETRTTTMTERQLKEELVALYEKMLIQETLYKQLLKKQWGIDEGVSAVDGLETLG